MMSPLSIQVQHLTNPPGMGAEVMGCIAVDKVDGRRASVVWVLVWQIVAIGTHSQRAATFGRPLV